jgi:hypothetical protein
MNQTFDSGLNDAST